MKKDHVLKDFFSYPMRFADFMNALFFDGHAIIHPCDLHPLDSREIFIGDFLSKECTHDVIMMWERRIFKLSWFLKLKAVLTLQWHQEHCFMMHWSTICRISDSRIICWCQWWASYCFMAKGNGMPWHRCWKESKDQRKSRENRNDMEDEGCRHEGDGWNLLKNEDNKKVISD